MTLPAGEIKALVEGGHEDVFAVLGPHVVDGRDVVVRAFLPQAASVRVMPLSPAASPRSMERLHPAGVFEAVFAGQRETFAYRLEVTADGATVEIEDPYRFPSVLSEYDRHLLAEAPARDR